MSSFVENWRSRWENSILEVFMLQSIAGKPRYGAELIELAQNNISSEIKIPTVYSILKRSKRLGFLDDYFFEEKDDITRGKKRRYYRLNQQGITYFNALVSIIQENQIFISSLKEINEPREVLYNV